LGQVTGRAGKIAIDATNAFPSRNEAFASLAEELKSFTGAPVAKSFNLTFAVLYDQITGQVMTDAGYDPVSLGGLDRARAVEDLAWVLAGAVKDGVPVFYRFAVPRER